MNMWHSEPFNSNAYPRSISRIERYAQDYTNGC